MANPNPNFLWLFGGSDETKTNLWMDLWMLTAETLESDTKMIWGGPIFSVSDEGDGDELDELEVDNLYDAVNLSCLIPDANATALNPIDIRNSTHLRT